MKTLSFLTLALGLAVTVNAQGLKGVGYDASMSGPGQVTARIGLSKFANLDLGVGFSILTGDSATNAGGTKSALTSDQKLDLALSAFYLGELQHWGPVSNYFVGGLMFEKLPRKNNNSGLGVVIGLQPEVTFMDHFAVAGRLGIILPVIPDFKIQSYGQTIDVNFKVLF